MPSICGVSFLMSYSAKTMSEFTVFRLPIKPDLLIALVSFVATIMTVFLIEHLGRKILLVGSLTATAIGLCAFQLSKQVFQYTEGIQFMILLLTVLTASLGLLPVTHIYKMDLLPSKVKRIQLSPRLIKKITLFF